MIETLCAVCFFVFKQKTAYEMRISDWSSDVCSSDLPVERDADQPREMMERRVERHHRAPRNHVDDGLAPQLHLAIGGEQIIEARVPATHPHVAQPLGLRAQEDVAADTVAREDRKSVV